MFGTILIDDKNALTTLKNVDKKASDSKSILDKISTAGDKIGKAIATGGAIAGGALVAMTAKITETTGAIKDSADKAGTTAEEYQKWSFAASQCGMSTEQLEKAMIKQQKSFADAKTGSASMSEAYKKLGIDISSIGSSSEAFDQVMTKLAGMKDETQRNALANDIFGKSYSQLTPLLNEGASGIDALKQKAVDLGGVMSNEAVASGEEFGDTLDQLKLMGTGLFNTIGVSLIPKLQTFANWIITNMPTIQSTAGTAFNFISNTIGFIVSKSNVLIPILSGLLTAFLAMKVIGIISGLMAAYTAFTTTATGAQIALSAAMMANPIGLIIAAIAALIAIGVALYLNWDTVKAVCIQAFGKVKEVVNGAITKVKSLLNSVINFVKNNWKSLLLLLANPFAGAFALAYKHCEGFRTKVNSILALIKNGISTKVNGIKTTISTVFGAIKNIMTNPFSTAKGIIEGIINKIKSFLNFNWEFPHLKMPHFKISGSMNPMKWAEEGVPSITVDWYAKGGIFSKPTIFNTPYGLKGVGDNPRSPEVVAPLHELKRMLGLDEKQQQKSITVNFYPQQMNDNEMDRAFKYINRRFGMEL